MKKNILWLLILLLSMSVAAAEEAAGPASEDPAEWSTTEIALYGRPQSDEPVHLTVGNTTKVNGSFFTTYFGNNTSDIDVRTMVHGYRPVEWDNQLQFVRDPIVTENLTRTPGAQGTVYNITLNRDLFYCDGVTPITARDYVFSWLLIASPEFSAIGANVPEMNIVGYEEYHSGESEIFTGIRLVSDYEFSVEVKTAYDPYFYELSQLALHPYPISVLAPGCAVADDGQGAYITNEDPTAERVYTAQLLAQTILDPENGYRSYPRMTSGPYKLVDYDPESGVVDFELNPFYNGNYEGVKPVIDTITLVPAETDNMIEKLQSGEIDLLNKCVDGKVIRDGIQLTGAGDYAMQNYARLGYGFCAMSCEQGPQQFVAVRQALMYAFDTDTFVNTFLSGFGLPVYGYYGIGQWMYGAVEGVVRPMEMTPEEEALWDELSLDALNHYDYDLEKAKELLVADGWTLDENGEAFDEGTDALRYKQVEDELMPLSLVFAMCKDNDAAQMVATMYTESLAQLGGELVVEEVPFTQLLEDYYRTDGQRKYDMNFMATNFVSTFDPYWVFCADSGLQGSVNTSGIVDEELVELAWEMRSTPPGDLQTFLERWLKMQERFNEVLPTLPIYSNVYFDFYTDWLQNYYANSEYSWPVAILYSFYAEPVQEEEEMTGEEEFLEEEDLLGDGEVVFIE